MLLAILFAGSGLLTYQIYYQVAKSEPNGLQLWLQFFTGLPFAVACSLRLMRPWKWTVPGVLLDAATWMLAYRIGVGLVGSIYPPLAMAIAGLVGALGVTASTGLARHPLFSRSTLLGSALIGALFGAPFGLVVNRSDYENTILAICFPLWQIALGVWLGRRCATTGA